MRNRHVIQLLIGCTIWCPFGLANPPVAKSFPKFENAFESLANDIHLYINKKAGGTVIITDDAFRGPAGEAGAGIARALREELEGRLTFRDFNAFRIEGSYSVEKKPDGKYLYVITSRIMNHNNRMQLSKNYMVTSDHEKAIETFAPSVDVTKIQVKTENDADSAPITSIEDYTSQQIGQAIAEPSSTTISITRPRNRPDAPASIVRYAQDSPYGVSIVKQNGSDRLGTPYKILLEGGIAHTEFNLSDVFAIRVHNDSSKHVGVKVLLDGINTFEFCEIPRLKETGKYCCKPSSSSDIRGWYINRELLNRFEVVERGSGAAAKIHRPSGIGAITVVFYEVLKTTSATTSQDDSTKSLNDLSIGQGESIKHSGRTEKTVFGKLLGSVSLRYVNGGFPNGPPL